MKIAGPQPRLAALLAASVCSIMTGAAAAQAAADELDFLLGDSTPATTTSPDATASEAPTTSTEAPATAPSATAETIETIPVASEPSQAADEVRPASRPRGMIEEIVVTAQKREENVQDVPIAISAFTGAKLEAQGAVTTKDLALVTPGLQVTELAGYTFVYLRGVGSDAFVASADPSVVTYVDGVYVPIGHGNAQELGGVERVEVLKGPQGTLFGRNSTGGAINVTTKRPGDEFEGSIALSYSDFNTHTAKAYFNFPLHETLALSVSGLYRGAESYYTRVGPFSDKEIPDDEVYGWRVRGRWNPTDNLELLLTAQYVDQTTPGSLVSANRRPSLLGGLSRVMPGDFETRADTQPLSAANQKSYYGTLTWSLPAFDIKLLGNDLLSTTTASQTDFDGTAQPLVSFFSPNEFTDLQTAELQILSNDGSWGSDWLTWVGGLYYLRSNAGFDPVVLQVANSALQLPTGELVNLIPERLRRLLRWVPAPSGIDVWLEGLIETKSESAFAQATAEITDWMSLTLGGRWQRELRRQSKSTVNLANIGGGLTPLLSYRPQEATVENFSPKASLDFRPADDVLVYLSWAKGFKSHTYNIINIYTRPEYVKPEEVTAYEIGIKADFFENSLRVNAAAFHNETQNMQSSVVSLLAGGAVRLENAGGARTRGAEFDLTWLPMPNANPGLSIAAGAAYLDAIYTSFPDGSGFDETTGLQRGNQDYTGNRMVRTPEWTGNLGITQQIDTRYGPFEIAADGYYNDGFYFLPQNGERSWEPSYVMVNGRLSYLVDNWGLRLTVFGHNLTDERYNIAQFHTDFGRLDTMAPPRTFGVRLNWDF